MTAWLKAADVLVKALLLIGTIVLFTGGVRLWVFDVRISMTSAARIYAWAALILALRHWYRPNLSAFAGLRQFLWTPSSGDAARLFREPGAGAWSGVRRLVLSTFGFAALVAALTWPQVKRLDSVPDLGDPLFSVWRIAWINHQLPRDPLALFDANIFHPERRTLAYSDPVLAPGVMAMPLFAVGMHPVVVYNLVFLSGFVLSGVAMFLLTRALTGRTDAAAVAGAIFALYPYRFEHYSHLELQMTIGMPLTLWALHRTIARGRLGDGIAAGAAFTLQALSSMYYGLLFAVYLVPLTAFMWADHRAPRRTFIPLAAGALLCTAVMAPIAAVYLQNRAVLGERHRNTVYHYSAEARDYLEPHRRSIYTEWREPEHPERELFPGVTPVVLAVIALWLPVSRLRLGYGAALLVARDLSLGLNGVMYPWLFEYLMPFRSLRVPARASILVGLTLAVLSAYGVARLLRRWPRWQVPLTAAIVGAVVVEAVPRMPLERVWPEPPAIYQAVGGQPAVLAEFPMSQLNEFPLDTRYMYFSTVHWHKLVNGNSGFLPRSYWELTNTMDDFPADATLVYLRSRGVTHIAVHGSFYADPAEYRSTRDVLEARSDVQLLAAVPWEGSETRLYRLVR